MSSAGQAVGGLVGGIAGFFLGGPTGAIYGAQIGIMAGGYIDPPKGPNGNPPSADSLRMQTSAYGVPLGRGYGRYARMGNLFWIEGNTLRAEEVEGQGGKGGASVPPTYAIYGTFAVGFGEREIASFRRLWFGSKLVYDAGSDSLSSLIASEENSGSFTFYTGSASQLPDPRIQADLGVDSTPAWRGMPYVVVKDWPMADFGNTLAGLQVKAEIVTVETATGMTLLQTVVLPANGGTGPSLAAQNMVTDNYTVFAFNDPLYSGYPSGGTVGQRKASFLASSFEGSVYIPGNNTGTIFINNSPTYIGTLTRDGQTAANHYYLNGVEMGNIPAAYQAEGLYIWVEEGGSTFLGITSGPDTAGPGTGDMYLVRTNIAGGTVQTAYLMAYNVFNQRPAIVVAGGVGYAIGKNFTYVFDLETLAVIDIRASAITSVAVDYSATVDETGRVWAWLGSGTNGVQRLNSTLTGYDMALDPGYGCPGVAVRNGILYTATFASSGDSAITCRAYRIAGTTPALVPLADIVEAECLLSGLLESADIDVSSLSQDVRGYRIDSIGAIRNSLTPLQAAWPFDVIPRGYQLKFIPRGQAAVATIDSDELGAVAGNQKPGVRITASREMDSQLPRRVQVSYIDANREYDVGAGPGSERLNTDAVNVQQTDLGIVLTANEAAGIEEALLYMYWLERVEVSFVLPPTYAHLEPADVVDVVDPAATYHLRLTNINYLPDGRLECQARFNNAAVYSPTAVGQEGIYTGQVVSLPGASQALLLDIPVLLDGMDTPGFTVAMAGYLPGWTGGSLIRSEDDGQSWINIQGFVPPGAVVGQLIAPLASGRTDLKDETNLIEVGLQSASDALYSVTEAQLLGGANHFAIGAHGRWEIVGAQVCAQLANGNWRLSSLLRGRFGTEWAIGSHAVGDTVIPLDSTRLKFISASINSIGLSRKYRAVTNGQTIASAAEQDFSYAGENLECLAPVELNGHIDVVTQDWTITAKRRTRVGGEWRDYVDASLGETSESYELEIWNSTYTTLKRTITGISSPSATYTKVNQIEDFGSVQLTVYCKFYQLSSVVGRGHPLIGSLTRNYWIETDPNFAWLVLGLHMDGTNGSTTFTDIKGKTVTAYGNAQIVTDGSAFGGAQANFDGSGDYLMTALHSDFQFGTGDFSISCFVTPNSIGTYQTIFGGKEGYDEMAFQIDTYGQLTVTYPYSGGNIDTTGSPLVTGTRYHVELSRISGVVYLFIDGVLRGSGAFTGNITYADAIYIGRINYATNYCYADMKIDDIRVYKGKGIHSSGFSVPIQAFPEA